MTEEELLIASLRKELASKDAAIKTKDETIKDKDETIKELIKAKDDDIKAKDDLLADLKERLAERITWESVTTKLVASATEMWQKWQRQWQQHCNNCEEGHRRRRVVIRQAVAQVTNMLDLTRALAKRLPHPALVDTDVFCRYLSFLDLKDFATVSRTCRAWRRGTHIVGNTYWRAIAHSRWPDYAAAIEAELGKEHDFQSACKEKLCDEDHRRIETWREQALPSFMTAEYAMYHGNPKGVPTISWLSHQGHITGSLTALSALSQEFGIVAPIFKRYERAALAMYDDRRGYCWTFGHLPPVPSNITDKRRSDHEKARSVVKAIYFTCDGRLLDEKPLFGYDSDAALYYATDFEPLSPTQVLAGITRLRSLETA